MNRLNKKLNNKGFSLVELIIVVAIMAILIAILAPMYFQYVDDSRNTTREYAAKEIATMLKGEIAQNDLKVSADTEIRITTNATTGNDQVTVVTDGVSYRAPDGTAFVEISTNTPLNGDEGTLGELLGVANMKASGSDVPAVITISADGSSVEFEMEYD